MTAIWVSHGPHLGVGNPAAALVRCEEQVFLVLINIIGPNAMS